jgi:hypothetical protein
MARRNRRIGKRKVDGYPVIDAATPLEVHVQQRDINRGRPSACECAIAKAIMRETGAQHVRVNATRIFIEKNGVLHRYKTPRGIFEQIELFDRTGDMGPGVYTIPPIDPAHALGAVFKSERAPGLRNVKPLKKRDRPIYRIEDDARQPA